MVSRWLWLILPLVLLGCGQTTLDEDSHANADTGTTAPVPGTASSSTASPTTATTSVAPPSTTTTTGLVLRTDGLGAVSFGDPVDAVMAILSELLGPPDWEEVQVAADTDLSVRWGEDRAEFLYLQFTDWDYFDSVPDPPQSMPEGPILHYYLTRSDLLATEGGITVGSTVGELKAAYPDVRFSSTCAAESVREFHLDPPEGWFHLPMWGYLDGEPTDNSTRVEYIGSGWDRSPC